MTRSMYHEGLMLVQRAVHAESWRPASGSGPGKGFQCLLPQLKLGGSSVRALLALQVLKLLCLRSQSQMLPRNQKANFLATKFPFE